VRLGITRLLSLHSAGIIPYLPRNVTLPQGAASVTAYNVIAFSQ
jgi:hypothetical protein